MDDSKESKNKNIINISKKKYIYIILSIQMVRLRTNGIWIIKLFLKQ